MVGRSKISPATRHTMWEQASTPLSVRRMGALGPPQVSRLFRWMIAWYTCLKSQRMTSLLLPWQIRKLNLHTRETWTPANRLLTYSIWAMSLVSDDESDGPLDVVAISYDNAQLPNKLHNPLEHTSTSMTAVYMTAILAHSTSVLWLLKWNWLLSNLLPHSYSSTVLRRRQVA